MDAHPGHRAGKKAGYKKPDVEAGVSLRQALQCIALAQEHHGKNNIESALDQVRMAERFLDEYVEKME